MALKITLKPDEKIIVGTSVIKNGGNKCELVIENRVPIIREREILKFEEATTPAKRIYLALQLLYLGELRDNKDLFSLIQDFVDAVPSSIFIIESILHLVNDEQHYKALKECKKLIEYEDKILNQVQD